MDARIKSGQDNAKASNRLMAGKATHQPPDGYPSIRTCSATLTDSA